MKLLRQLQSSLLLAFFPDVSSAVITDYCRWVCQALITLEQSGIDSAIYAVSFGNNRFSGSYDSLRTRIEVKREGERSDYLQWSALFSPGSYRQLGFFSHLLAGDFLGKKVSSGFGSSQSGGWNVRWIAETKTISITHVSKGAREFPEREMTEKLISALSQARGN